MISYINEIFHINPVYSFFICNNVDYLIWTSKNHEKISQRLLPNNATIKYTVVELKNQILYAFTALRKARKTCL